MASFLWLKFIATQSLTKMKICLSHHLFLLCPQQQIPAHLFPCFRIPIFLTFIYPKVLVSLPIYILSYEFLSPPQLHLEISISLLQDSQHLYVSLAPKRTSGTSSAPHEKNYPVLTQLPLAIPFLCSLLCIYTTVHSSLIFSSSSTCDPATQSPTCCLSNASTLLTCAWAAGPWAHWLCLQPWSGLILSWFLPPGEQCQVMLFAPGPTKQLLGSGRPIALGHVRSLKRFIRHKVSQTVVSYHFSCAKEILAHTTLLLTAITVLYLNDSGHYVAHSQKCICTPLHGISHIT